VRKTKLKYTTAAVVATLVSAAFLFSVLRVTGTPPVDTVSQESSELFSEKGCSQCHYAESKDRKAGPGLKGLFERETLPVSGRAATEENVRRQLQAPYRNMPSFADRLTEQEVNELIAYMKTL
jgi:cytochrome c2